MLPGVDHERTAIAAVMAWVLLGRHTGTDSPFSAKIQPSQRPADPSTPTPVMSKAEAPWIKFVPGGWPMIGKNCGIRSWKTPARAGHGLTDCSQKTTSSFRLATKDTPPSCEMTTATPVGCCWTKR
jgi:hypothetical protein